MSQSAPLESSRLAGFEYRPIQLVANVVELLEVAHEAFEKDRETAKASITQATFILRSELQRHEAASKVEFGSGKLAGWQVQRLKTYVDSHLGESVQVSDLSSIV